MINMFSYVAIPSENFERAFKFYFEITNGLIQRNPKVPFPMAYFIDEKHNNVGHLFQLPNFRPSKDGTIVYLEVNDINKALNKIELSGGKVVMPKTIISKKGGFWALFLDSEGNRLALHSKNYELKIIY